MILKFAKKHINFISMFGNRSIVIDDCDFPAIVIKWHNEHYCTVFVNQELREAYYFNGLLYDDLYQIPYNVDDDYYACYDYDDEDYLTYESLYNLYSPDSHFFYSTLMKSPNRNRKELEKIAPPKSNY